MTWPFAGTIQILKHASLLREAAINQVLIAHPHEEFERACRSAGIGVTPEDQVQFVTLKELTNAAPGKPLVLREGQWPGIGHGPNIQPFEEEIASASSQPWVDSNGSWIAYLRALFPDRPPALGYLPDLGNRLAPFDSLELALIEAWTAGGNYVMALDPRFRTALVKGDEKARAARRQLGRTAGWLQQHTELFRQPTFPSITQLVEEGESTAEIAHMLFRQNASPALANAAEPPAPDPERRRVIVAVELKPPPVPIRNRILAHAQAGASVLGGPEHRFGPPSVVAGCLRRVRKGDPAGCSFVNGRVRSRTRGSVASRGMYLASE